MALGRAAGPAAAACSARASSSARSATMPAEAACCMPRPGLLLLGAAPPRNSTARLFGHRACAERQHAAVEAHALQREAPRGPVPARLGIVDVDAERDLRRHLFRRSFPPRPSPGRCQAGRPSTARGRTARRTRRRCRERRRSSPRARAPCAPRSGSRRTSRRPATRAARSARRTSSAARTRGDRAVRSAPARRFPLARSGVSTCEAMMPLMPRSSALPISPESSPHVRTSVATPAARAASTNGSSVAKSLAECSMSSTMKSKPARAMAVTTPGVGSSIRNVPSAKPLAVRWRRLSPSSSDSPSLRAPALRTWRGFVQRLPRLAVSSINRCVRVPVCCRRSAVDLLTPGRY